MAIVQTEFSRGIERLRRALADTPHVNMTSVWLLAAVVELPFHLALATATVIYAHMWWRVWNRLQARPAYRVICSWAVVVLSILSVHLVMQSLGLSVAAPVANQGIPLVIALIVAILTYSTVNSAFVAMFMYLFSGKKTVLALWGTTGDNALEIATLSAGGLTAVALSVAPALILLILPLLLVVHRAVLVRQLQVQASTDSKTGLLNAATWTQLAEKERSRAQRSHREFGVLMVDLDHFKRVNDTYGHLAGDAVLLGVSTILKQEIRDYDHAGRFGGEEFVALLPDSDPVQVMAVAERVRSRITELAVDTENGEGDAITVERLSASIGAASYPMHGNTVHALLRTADSHLYVAKNNGRNQVVGIDTAGITQLPNGRNQAV
ncbi:MAG: GGDEF domain-containing protein [Sciscionella sp.]